MKNLADPEIAWQGIPWSDTSDISPTTAAACDQDQLEPSLPAHAERSGANVRFNTELPPRHSPRRPTAGSRPWEVAASVADRYSDRHVFLVGDSAHVMPPTGGFGGNTGIQDAHNLAWKLEMVVRGVAGRRLLDTYDEERRLVADRTVAQALARLQAWFEDPSRTLPPPEPIVDGNAVIFGYRPTNLTSGDQSSHALSNRRSRYHRLRIRRQGTS